MAVDRKAGTGTGPGQYVTRASQIADRHGFGGIRLLNHWTIAESSSTRALAHPEKVGPRADEFLHEVLAAQPGVPVLGVWGSAIAEVDDLTGHRVRDFVTLAAALDRQIVAVGVNTDGQPRHLSSFRPFALDSIALLAWIAPTSWLASPGQARTGDLEVQPGNDETPGR